MAMEWCLLDFELTDSEPSGSHSLENRRHQRSWESLPSLNKTSRVKVSLNMPSRRGRSQDSAQQKARPFEARWKPSAAVSVFRPTPATTEHGKEIQRELGGSGAYVDAIVEQVASKRSGVPTREEEQPN